MRARHRTTPGGITKLLGAEGPASREGRGNRPPAGAVGTGTGRLRLLAKETETVARRRLRPSRAAGGPDGASVPEGKRNGIVAASAGTHPRRPERGLAPGPAADGIAKGLRLRKRFRKIETREPRLLRGRSSKRERTGAPLRPGPTGRGPGQAPAPGRKARRGMRSVLRRKSRASGKAQASSSCGAANRNNPANAPGLRPGAERDREGSKFRFGLERDLR